MHKEVTNKQMILALREKTYEALNAFDPVEHDAEELVKLQFVISQLMQMPSYKEVPVEIEEN